MGKIQDRDKVQKALEVVENVSGTMSVAEQKKFEYALEILIEEKSAQHILDTVRMKSREFKGLNDKDFCIWQLSMLGKSDASIISDLGIRKRHLNELRTRWEWQKLSEIYDQAKRDDITRKQLDLSSDLISKNVDLISHRVTTILENEDPKIAPAQVALTKLLLSLGDNPMFGNAKEGKGTTINAENVQINNLDSMTDEEQRRLLDNLHGKA